MSSARAAHVTRRGAVRSPIPAEQWPGRLGLLPIGPDDLEVAQPPEPKQEVAGAATDMPAPLDRPYAGQASDVTDGLLNVRRGVDQMVQSHDVSLAITGNRDDSPGPEGRSPDRFRHKLYIVTIVPGVDEA